MKSIVVLLALLLASCGTTPPVDTHVPHETPAPAPQPRPEAPVEPKIVYVPLGVSPELLDPDACPRWPRGNLPTDEEQLSEFMFDAFRAYRCERLTRNQIREEQNQQRREIEQRNR